MGEEEHLWQTFFKKLSFLIVLSNKIKKVMSLDTSFLVYRNAVDFCILILYTVTLPNL